MQRKAVAEARIKSEGDDLGPGELIAYASVFGNRDSFGDVVEPGAFTDTLAAWKSKGDRIPLVWAHGTDPGSYLGYVLDASEDETGLKIHARIDLDSPHGRTVHRMVADRTVNQLSFAYSVRDSESRGDHVALKSLDLHEVTLCYRGANDQTHVVAVKGNGDNTIQPMKGEGMGIKEQRETVANKAREIVDGAKAEGVELTAEQAAEVAGMLDQVKAFDAQIAERQKSADLVAAVEALGGSSAAPAESGSKSARPLSRGYLALTGTGAKSAAREAATKMLGSQGRKGIVAPGEHPFSVPLVNQSPMELDRVPTSIVDVLTVVTHDAPAWQYLRQSVRENKAAPVAAGALKPTSIYTTDKVDGKLETIAHLSEPLDRYTLIDNGSLEAWVRDEMLFGLRQAVEAQALLGDGTDNNLTGILNTEGIVSQPYADDLVSTTRRAITKLEAAGRTPGVFVLSPADWESLELFRNDSGNFDLARSAVDRAAQKLHGVRVVLSTALPAAKGVLLDLDAVQLDTDTHGLVIENGTVGDQFARNQKVMLVEGRFGVSVLRPSGVVEIATSGE